MARHRGKSSIPANIIAEADAALGERNERLRKARDEATLNQRCEDAASTFLKAEEALWHAEHGRPCSCLKAFRDSLMAVSSAFSDAGRLDSWRQVNHDEVFGEYRLSRGTTLEAPIVFRWAQMLFDNACLCDLPERTLLETWDKASLRYAFRWLRIFVAELSGQGAVLNRQGQRVIPSKPAAPPVADSAEGMHPDGPEKPHWLWLNGQRQKIGKGRAKLSWRLLNYFWSRESASYEELQGQDRTPWLDGVTDSGIAAAVNRFNLVIPPALMWKLRTKDRTVYKEVTS
jgi:hypothetical protein